MPKIYLLYSDQELRNRLVSQLKRLMPQLEVYTLDTSGFPDNMDSRGEINVFVVEAGRKEVDYRKVGAGLSLLSKDYGVSVLALFSGQEKSAADIEEYSPDGLIDFPCEDSLVVSQIEYLIKISELRAMSLNLRAQLSRRVSRLAGLEQQLRHTNWLLEALNRCDEVIIKANSEKEILENVCEIMASSLEPCLVMVGYAEMDQSSSVKIAAARGEKRAMSRDLKLSWDAGPWGQGPTGTAIRTGKTVYVPSPVNDSSTASWKDLFKANDIKYILALPIAHAGVGFGALSIYGAKKGEFSQDDLHHFERVAQNMGYGIWFLRHRHKRKLVEEELHKTNELFTLAMEATEDALWDWGVSTGRMYFSPRWYTMLGYEPNELPMEYESFLKVVHPEDIERVQRELKESMERSVNYSLEFRALTKDGQTRWILARGKVVDRDRQGKPVRIVGTHVDITPRKEMEQELNNARYKAETANKAKDRFLEAMSHELRTPLNGIMSILQTLGEADLGSSEKEYIQMALDSSRQLLMSINKILELSSLQKGLRCIYRQPFNLDQEMTRIAHFFRPMAENKNLYLDLNISNDISSEYEGDISIIRQILWNYLENAIKFTQKGGVLLRVYAQNDHDVRSEDKPIQMVFEVIDTGAGIPDEIQEKLFEPFRIIEDPQLSSSGHGIGLSVCKQLAETMGARIGMDSSKGQGSRFYLAVELEPLKTVEEAVDEKPEAAVARKDRQIMVVEDEKVNLMLIERMLKDNGFQVLTASDGQEALLLLQQNPGISLVLMDIMVPKYNGYELAAMIRQGQFAGLKDVPIVAVTALADSDSRQKCFESGMNAYLSKPIDNQDLMGMVGKYIDA